MLSPCQCHHHISPRRASSAPHTHVPRRAPSSKTFLSPQLARHHHRPSATTKHKPATTTHAHDPNSTPNFTNDKAAQHIHSRCLSSAWAAARKSHRSRKSHRQRPRSIWCRICTVGMCSSLSIPPIPTTNSTLTYLPTLLPSLTNPTLLTQLPRSLLKSCTSKCIDPAYREADLNKGESVCLDRCVAKFFEVNVKVSEKMQGEAQGRGGMMGGM